MGFVFFGEPRISLKISLAVFPCAKKKIGRTTGGKTVANIFHFSRSCAVCNIFRIYYPNRSIFCNDVYGLRCIILRDSVNRPISNH